jgi:hypothetical protein
MLGRAENVQRGRLRTVGAWIQVQLILSVHAPPHNSALALDCSVMNAGCCKILLHPRWGSVRPLCSVPFLQMLCLSKATVVVVRQAVYPASIFTTAPAECVLAVLKSLPRVDTNASNATESHGSHEDLCSVSESNIS